jgi:hypothetical protein
LAKYRKNVKDARFYYWIPMKRINHKSQLIETIQTSRSQLDHYLFYFKKDSSGDFIPSDRLKFKEEELHAAGVLGSWSLYTVLEQVRASEQAFLQRHMAGIHSAGGASTSNIAAMSGYLGGLFGAPEVLPLPQFLERWRASYQEIVDYSSGLPEELLFDPQPTALAAELLEATCERYDWAKEHIHRWQQTRRQEQAAESGSEPRVELLHQIDLERRKLEKTLGSLDPSAMERPGVVGNWSVKDLLAHLAAWEGFFLSWYRAGVLGETPEIPAPGFTWKQMHQLNELIFQEHRLQSLEDVQAWFARSYQEIHQVVEGIPEKDLFEPGRYPWQGKHPLTGFIKANTCNHYRWANTKIRDWMKSDCVF